MKDILDAIISDWVNFPEKRLYRMVGLAFLAVAGFVVFTMLPSGLAEFQIVCEKVIAVVVLLVLAIALLIG